MNISLVYRFQYEYLMKKFKPYNTMIHSRRTTKQYHAIFHYKSNPKHSNITSYCKRNTKLGKLPSLLESCVFFFGKSLFALIGFLFKNKNLPILVFYYFGMHCLYWIIICFFDFVLVFRLDGQYAHYVWIRGNISSFWATLKTNLS